MGETNWQTIFAVEETIGQSGRVCWNIDVPEATQRLRLQYHLQAPDIDPAIQDAFVRSYCYQAGLQPAQQSYLDPGLREKLFSVSAILGFELFDAQQQWRGRCDVMQTGWRELSRSHASPGLFPGAIWPGGWRIEFDATITDYCSWIGITFEVQATGEPPSNVHNLIQWRFDKQETAEQPQARWRVGEWFETTNRSNGPDAPEDLLQRYHQMGYEFVHLADRNVPPIHELTSVPPIQALRGMALQESYAELLFIGLNEPFSPDEMKSSRSNLETLAYLIHRQGALLAVRRPFGLSDEGRWPSWQGQEEDWRHVDFIEVWHGLWEESMPEIIRNLQLWDRLLNRGLRIFALGSKGAHAGLTAEQIERLPKSLVFADSNSESALLTALVNGRSYITVEPVVNFWVESMHGNGMIGDELRLAVDLPFSIHLQASQMDPPGYMIIRCNKGIYCQMPLPSKQDANLRFMEVARAGIQWYRVEIYQFGRPIDQLAVVTNPIFVRGMSSW